MCLERDYKRRPTATMILQRSSNFTSDFQRLKNDHGVQILKIKEQYQKIKNINNNQPVQTNRS